MERAIGGGDELETRWYYDNCAEQCLRQSFFSTDDMLTLKAFRMDLSQCAWTNHLSD
ncbi:hypothetical protein KIN20_030414 [Parelaphostrongylus tenuis]|uniref:Uncharacterized protein n=1 Tax=Parelaphostrongylus tenuis TaxID=148309 RepID=A0AAD5WGD1_PARTN|nr:hypothetical protein KIN20_030414 [Parelaphostrongylus tenuis]